MTLPGSKPPVNVILAATTWCVNGVNAFSANLARGLTRAGVPAHVLLTEEHTALVETRETMMPRPGDVAFHSLPLPIVPVDGWGLHWGAMVRYLEERAPCIYIPNYDWRHSCVCPQLSADVVVVGIVHSDDPLHYDHVRRLGPYWNVVVAVSKAVAARTADACPAVRDRIVTIRNGVPLTPTRPPRAAPGRALRLVYHGALKQVQKRVLDLPKIVEAAAAAGVPVELTIAGAGPDEAALRAAAAPLVDRKLVQFAGVMTPDAAAALLDRHDVYVLASEFEGLPNALIEAMGHGCVPVVTRAESGVPELIADGDNGFLLDVGDFTGFAERFRLLWTDAERLDRMSMRAFETVRRGGYAVEDMVAAYRQTFASAWEAVESGRFVRPHGSMVPPPPAIDGIGLLSVPLSYRHPELGSFPSADDAEDYEDQVRAIVRQPAAASIALPASPTLASRVRRLDDLTVIVTAPNWLPNGVNSWCEDLVRGLRGAGINARLLLTEESTELVTVEGQRLPRPGDLPVEELRITGLDNWGARWGAMIRLLEAAAPCIYLPTYDWRHSCVVPALSDRVMVVGTVHDADALYTEHAERVGHYWNAVVATSRPIARHIRERLPVLERRLATIPHDERMIATYVDLFRRVTADVAGGRFRRAPGPILPPPPSVDGWNVFPMSLKYRSELGAFPSLYDAIRFQEESKALPEPHGLWRSL